MIVEAVNALRARYTYLFTTGGIGPTHDDITADCVAEGLRRRHRRSTSGRGRMLLERHKPEDLNAARLRMARIPFGADLIANPVSKAPGFRIGNVHVMAGVPSIMQAMLDRSPRPSRAAPRMLSETIEAAGLAEGSYAGGLGEIAKARPAVSIGSYPA